MERRKNEERASMDDERVEASRDGIGVESLDNGRITFDTGQRNESDVRDPVCGTRLPGATGPSIAYQGMKYFFCGETCRQDFIKDPARYLQIP
jgi:YHS domain-containing protein